MASVIPLKQRPIDIIILIFFWINILFITYIVDIEQLVIDDPDNFTYPIWPPKICIDLTHWWGRSFDPLLIARPAFWRGMIWLDAIVFGPFYIFAIYAYTKGKEWIRIPSIFYAGLLFADVLAILFEEFAGEHAAIDSGLVGFANLPWIGFPLIILARMYKPHPFTSDEQDICKEAKEIRSASLKPIKNFSADAFFNRYGKWAVVAGASEGIGGSFAERLGSMGFNLMLIARRQKKLDTFADKIKSEHGVDVKTIAGDVGAPETLNEVLEATKDLEVGFLVYNAACSPIGLFHSHDIQLMEKVLKVNCSGPMHFAYHFGNRFKNLGRGGIILLSSMSGFQGTAMVANYAATKAYNTVLAEGLNYELRKHNVDCMACIAGATLTPAYNGRHPRISSVDAPKMEPEDVVEEALRNIGKRGSFVPGRMNRLSMFIINRLMSRQKASNIISKTTVQMFSDYLDNPQE